MARTCGSGGGRLSDTGTTAGDDAIEGAIGHSADGVAVGKNIRTNRQSARSDPQQSTSNYFGEQGGSNQWVIAQILDHGQMIRELTARLDDLPAKFVDLKSDVRKLQEVEITVRDKEVVLRPLPPPDAVVLPMRTLLIFLLVFGAGLTLLVAYLLWQVIYA